jgi:hypothetical protein
MPSQQYLRQLSLVVADPAGQGLELGELRVVFEVRRGDTQTPNIAPPFPSPRDPVPQY